MNCKGLNRQCVLPVRHPGKCQKAVANTVANAGSSVANIERPKADETLRGGPSQPVEAASRSTESERVEKWRASNRKAYNERQRDLMRKRRAGKKPLGIAYG